MQPILATFFRSLNHFPLLWNVKEANFIKHMFDIPRTREILSTQCLQLVDRLLTLLKKGLIGMLRKIGATHFECNNSVSQCILRFVCLVMTDLNKHYLRASYYICQILPPALTGLAITHIHISRPPTKVFIKQQTSYNVYHHVLLGIDMSKNELRIVHMCKKQGSHKHYRNADELLN